MALYTSSAFIDHSQRVSKSGFTGAHGTHVALSTHESHAGPVSRT